jgi:hypothetical protein
MSWSLRLTSRRLVRPKERSLSRSASVWDELGDRVDAGRLQAVAGADGELELADGHVELADEFLVDAGGGGGLSLTRLLAELEVLHEGVEVLAEDLAGLDQGHLGVTVPLVQISR